jgi:copper(I)-binding protein
MKTANGPRWARFAIATSAALLAGAALAHEYYAGHFTIVHPWALATEAPTAEVYVKFESVAADDVLIAAHTDIAEHVELRRDGQSPLKNGFVLTKGQDAAMAPNGAHFLLVGLKTPLQQDRSYPLTMEFEKSGKIDTVISIGEH